MLYNSNSGSVGGVCPPDSEGVFMDWIMIGLAGLVLLCGSFAGSFVFQMLNGWSIQMQIASLRNSIKGSASVAVRQDKAERINGALIEAAALLKAGKSPIEIGKEILPRYPDVALDLFKEFRKLQASGALEEIMPEQ